MYLNKAKEDFNELKDVVKNHTGSFDELMTKLEGYNVQTPILFDVNFGTINATIICKEGKFSVCNIVDIYDKDSCEIVNKDYMMEGGE